MMSQLRGAGHAQQLAAPREQRPRRRAAAVSVRADESMTEAYARIRAQRAKTKAKYERDEALEKAGPLGGASCCSLFRTL